MKLRDLRGAIRKPGNPSIIIELAPGRPMTLPLQKTPLLEELGRAYGNDSTAETGITYDLDTGILSGSATLTLPLSGNPRADYAAHEMDSLEDDDIL